VARRFGGLVVRDSVGERPPSEADTDFRIIEIKWFRLLILILGKPSASD